jgi:DNA-binding winged helix-turn-helix (wHTH) protein
VVTRRRELLTEGRPVALGSRAFDVLHALLDARGAIVPTDELLAKVWTSAAVEERNLRAQIFALRKALGPEGADLIANVARRGYRFTGELVELPKRATAADDRCPDGRPSIAILPFHNLSSEARQNYFAEGIAEELTMALSRFGWLLVVAHTTPASQSAAKRSM